MAVVLDNRYSRSFSDALSLARNRRDQATIYYSKDGVRAVYEVTTDYSARSNNTGLMISGGKLSRRETYPLESFRTFLACAFVVWNLALWVLAMRQ